MGMQFGGDDLCRWVAGSDGGGLAAGGGTAIQQARTGPDQRGNKLRGFVLNEDAVFAEGCCRCDVSRDDNSRRAEERARSKLNAVAL